jgi:pimeloyl-ACP methyl ester carboxylesterase
VNGGGMQPFQIHIDDAVLADLHFRLENTRWPDQIENAGWDYGTNLDYLVDLTNYWKNIYDWKKEESELNILPQYLTEIDGYNIHFVYIKGESKGALPLIMTSGWPSSFIEFKKVIGLLVAPSKYNSLSKEAFDLVIPTVPGYGFSGPVSKRGFVRVDILWRKLMTEVLGYKSFVAHGTDVGARVTSDLARYHEDVVKAIHIGSVDLDWPEEMPPNDQLTKDEKDYIARAEHWGKEEGAYRELQGTYPQTIAYALNDSPVGLASWIIEKYYKWSDCKGNIENVFTKDELLDNIMIYWVTQTINSSMRRYYEVRKKKRLTSKIKVPTAIAMFPGESELLVPKSWVERTYPIVQWTDMLEGGHFPALEKPELLVEDIRNAFRQYR